MKLPSSVQILASTSNTAVGPKYRKALTITRTPVTIVASGRSTSVVKHEVGVLHLHIQLRIL